MEIVFATCVVEVCSSGKVKASFWHPQHDRHGISTTAGCSPTRCQNQSHIADTHAHTFHEPICVEYSYSGFFKVPCGGVQEVYRPNLAHQLIPNIHTQGYSQ